MSEGSQGKTEADGRAGRITPGAHLRAELQRLGLDQVAVSKATGVSRQSVNNIINGRQTISRAMAGKLARLTGHSSDYWLSDWFGKARRQPAAPQRIAGLLVNHQIARAVKDGIIGIEPFASRHLRAASIDLTLNPVLTKANGDRVNIGRGKHFVLEPGRAVNVTTLESIELPRDFLGRTGAVAGLCGQGIIASNPFQVEPGFRGRLSFSLFNAGEGPVRLRAYDPVIGLEIIRLGATPDNGRTAACETKLRGTSSSSGSGFHA